MSRIMATDHHRFSIDNVIEDNVRISNSIIGERVVIRKNAVVNRGCIIGPGVIIDEQCVVPPYTRLTTIQQWERGHVSEPETGRNTPSKPYNVEIVGPQGVGYVWEYRGIAVAVLGVLMDDISVHRQRDI